MPAPPARPVPVPRRQAIETLGSGMEGLRRNREADVRRRAAEVRSRAEHDLRHRRQRELEAQRLEEARARAERAEAEARRLARRIERVEKKVKEPFDPMAIRERTRHGVARVQLAALLSDRVTLRSAFVLKELLDPPVALRERGEETTLPS